MTTTTEVTRPEYWLIEHKATGQWLSDAWFDHQRGTWVVQFDVIETTEFPTRAAALDAFKAYRIDPRRALLRHVPETRRCTEAGKAAVAARRAARNAERKLS